VVALPGTGTIRLPFRFDHSSDGDTAAFAAPGGIAVHVTDSYGNSRCEFSLHDATNGRAVANAKPKPGNGNDTRRSLRSATIASDAVTTSGAPNGSYTRVDADWALVTECHAVLGRISRGSPSICLLAGWMQQRIAGSDDPVL